MVINRLIQIKNINVSNNDDIIKLMYDILDKNTNIYSYVIYYLFKLLEKNNNDYISINIIKIQILNRYPQILYNLFSYMLNETIYIYLLFLNTPDSEIFQENLENKEKVFLKSTLINMGYIEYINQYVWRRKICRKTFIRSNKRN